MKQETHVHIVHGVASWRAKLAFMIRGMGHHAEIYEDFAELTRQRPTYGVLLVEGNLSIEQGQESTALRSLQAALGLPFIVFDQFADAGRAFEAGRAGASGYIDPDELEARLPGMILRAAEDTHASDARRLAIRSRQLLATLTRREFEVLECITEGMTSKNIGRLLGVSHRTVEIHRANAFHKIKAGSIAHATRLFVVAGQLNLAA